MWEFFLRNRKFTQLLVPMILLFGVVSLAMIPKEAQPDVNIPVAVVTTAFPGASALDVEEFVTQEIEDRITGLSGISTMQSTSSRGISMIFVEFETDVDTQEKVNDLKSRVDLAAPYLPSDAMESLVQKVSFSDLPILALTVSGPYGPSELKGYAEVLRDEVERVSGVSTVNLTGGRDREIKVNVDRAELERYGLSISQVSQAIALSNADIPVGSIETAGEVFGLRFAGKLADAEAIRNVPIASRGDALVLVRDVANVIDTVKDETSISRLSIAGAEPLPAVTLTVFKVSGGNVLAIVDDVEETMRDVQMTSLPDDVRVETTEDNAAQIRTDLGDLSMNGIETAIIVFLLLLVFLGLREAMIAGLAIPFTFLITFAVLNALGLTLNSLTLFSLILSLGILVDSAIVITEAMNTALREGMAPKDAAFHVVRKYKLPLISGTLTTVFAFVPMLLVGGIMGEFIKSIPISVSIVLAASLFVALSLIPVLGMRVLRGEVTARESSEKRVRTLTRLQDAYLGRFDALLLDPKKAKRFAAVLIVGFIVSLALPITGILKVNMFPEADFDVAYVNVVAPVGTSLEETTSSMDIVADELMSRQDIERFVINVGSNANSSSIMTVGGPGNAHLAHATVNLKEDRDFKTGDFLRELQRDLDARFAGSVIEVSAVQRADGPDDVPPVMVRIIGDDLTVLETLTHRIETLLNEVDGAEDVQTSLQETNGEFVLRIDRMKAQLYGMSAMQVAGMLRTTVFGTEATTVSEGGDDVEVTVRAKLDPSATDPRANVADIGTISSLTVATPRGDVPISTFLETRLEGGQASIAHEDGERVMRVTSRLAKDAAVQDVVGALQKKLETEDIPDGYELKFGGELEDIAESFADLFRSMILGIFLIAGLLVWQFRSYRQPLFILVTIPLALIGVLPGLAFVGQPLSFPGFIGIVALSGIVVNNAILLIDDINARRRTGTEKHDAVREAARSRLQPILLTTITTVSGILPLVLTNPTWGPLGYSIIFGLVFSTVLTLFAVPLLYARYGEVQLED